jgi:hypothetical protein
MTSKTRQALDKAVDILEKCSTPATRAGNTIERVGKMAARNVPHEKIAAEMTKRSKNNVTWTPQKVGVLCDLFRDCKTQVLVTASRASALIDDHALDLDDDSIATPA